VSGLSRRIERLVGEYLRAPWSDAERGLVEASGALPVYRTWEALLLVRPDGGVLAHRYAGARGSLEEAREPARTLALVTAAERHPELAALLPPRPPGAEDCATCTGRGRLSFGEGFTGGPLCGRCRGLGWLERGLLH